MVLEGPFCDLAGDFVLVPHQGRPEGPGVEEGENFGTEVALGASPRPPCPPPPGLLCRAPLCCVLCSGCVTGRKIPVLSILGGFVASA